MIDFIRNNRIFAAGINKSALQIAGVSSTESALVVKGKNENNGMQIDLLIDRADDVVNVCEMKFNKTAISIAKDYAEKLAERISTLAEANPAKTFHLTLVSAAPLKTNKYSDIFTSKVTIDELFK